jgi:hypothetical protein
LNDLNFPKAVRHIAAVADIPVVEDDDEDVHSDCSDDTSCSTWRTPPQDLRGNKYQNEMKVSFFMKINQEQKFYTRTKQYE